MSLSPAKRSVATPRHGKVLIADDEQSICRLIAAALAPLDLATEVVDDGHNALELILANRDGYDLLVLDMSMPGLDGDQVFERVREAGIETPVLFISGHDAHDLERRIGDADKVTFLAKPFRIDELLDLCLELLAQTAPAVEIEA